MVFFDTEKAADRFSTKGKGRMVKWFEELRAFADSVGGSFFSIRLLINKVSSRM